MSLSEVATSPLMWSHLFNIKRLETEKCGNYIFIHTKVQIKVTNKLQSCSFHCLKQVRRLSLKWSIDAFRVLSSAGALISQECSFRKTFTSRLCGGRVDERSVQLEHLWTSTTIPYIESQLLFKLKAPGFTYLCAHIHHSESFGHPG